MYLVIETSTGSGRVLGVFPHDNEEEAIDFVVECARDDGYYGEGDEVIYAEEELREVLRSKHAYEDCGTLMTIFYLEGT